MQAFDREKLQKIQDGIAELAGIYLYCVDADGNTVTKLSGEPKEGERLLQLIGKENIEALYNRLRRSSLEDQIIEDTSYENVKTAAVTVRKEGKPTMCWLAYCVLEKEFTKRGHYADGFLHVTSESAFTQALDLLRMWLTEEEKEQAEKGGLGRIVKLLLDRSPFEQLAGQLLQLMQEKLTVSNMQLLKLSRDGKTYSVIAETSVHPSLLQAAHGEAVKPEPVCGSEAVIVSGIENTDGQKAAFLKEAKIGSLITVPISIRGTISMYLCALMEKQVHEWSTEEIRYTTDMAKVLQSILDNRIARNSIVSSYQSLTQILNTVGSCIYVRDKETGQVLFCNDLMQHEFEQELKKGTINRLLEQAESALVKNGYYELKHPSRKHWYDLHQTEIDWVDGRKVSFSALYDITDKKLYQRKIEQQAYTDFLTGLYNRMCCERDLAQYIEKAEAEGGKGGLLYLDLDDFKHINDGLGHQYGDVLLKSISHSLQRIPEIHNTCYRMGGDEFVIVVPPESFARFDGIVEEIKAIFSRPWFLKNADYYCTMSMGICYFPEDGSSVQDLIKKADIAMYEAKKSGKNRVAVYSDNISSISNKRLDMEKNMRDATAGDYKEFEVYYQPIIDIQKEGTPCVGAEALVRWNSATLGFIPPSDFIPLAEYLGLINPIGNHVMKEACKACKYWNTHGHPEFKVNVNLSVVQLLQTDIVETIEETIRQSGINPHNLTLEVTESLAINDMERMKKILNQIRGLGARIALDDFGTGYSSLNHIREIPLDVIKVDQSFVSDLTEDSYSQSFIKMVAELAGAIGVSICIEGIETREQYKVLEGMKVRLVQGYYFDRPMTREDFDKKYVTIQSHANP